MQQVAGSFLFFDEDKKRLSDLGQYSTSMRKRACPERVQEMFKFDKQIKRVAPGVALNSPR